MGGMAGVHYRRRLWFWEPREHAEKLASHMRRWSHPLLDRIVVERRRILGWQVVHYRMWVRLGDLYDLDNSGQSE